MYADLDTDEKKLVFGLGAVLLGNALATHISSVVAISGFLNAAGANRILIIWTIDAVLIAAAAGLQTLFVDRFDRPTLLLWMSFGFMLAFVILRLMVALGARDWLNYALLYLLADLQWLFFPLILWVLANDTFDPTQAKRLFPLISAGGALGQIVGLTVAALSPGFLSAHGFSTAELLTFNALVYLLISVLVFQRLRSLEIRRTAFNKETVRETLTEGVDFVREVLSFRYLMIATIALIVCESVIEFNFFTITEAAFTNLNTYQTFYSLYRLGVTLATIAMQVFLTSRIIERVGLKNAFLITPVTLLVGSLWMMIGLPVLVSGVGAMVIYKFMQGSLDESSRKSFEAMVPEERRGRVSTFMESYVLAAGTILSTILLSIIILVGNHWPFPVPAIYAGLGVVAAAVSILAVTWMRSSYDTSLLNWRLKRRQRGASVLDKLDF
jgi:ATP:ADP antiporter, AAA family